MRVNVNIAEELGDGLADLDGPPSMTKAEALTLIKRASISRLLEQDIVGRDSYYLMLSHDIPIPATKLNEDVLCTRSAIENTDGATLLFRIAQKGLASNIPKKYLTQRSLMLRNKKGHTTLALLAACGELALVPKKLLTQENLLKPDVANKTAFLAACAHSFSAIPPELLTEANLLERDNEGFSGFHALALSGNLGKLPAELLTFENLTLQDNSQGRPLVIAGIRKTAQELSIFQRGNVLTMTEQTKKAWLKAFGKMEKPATLLEDFTHVEKHGSWQEL